MKGRFIILKVFEAFSGIGTQRMALRNLGIEHEVVGISEIDKFALKSYEAIHGELPNYGDISKLDPSSLPDIDLFTYSFPCQDISIAGGQAGFSKGTNTRSGLLWEAERVIRAKKPKYLLMENVKNLVGNKFKGGFQEWLDTLQELGYTNYWQVLNAKDYGVPQNRERVFCVSILGEHEPYTFPEPQTLNIKLKDVLEDEVDEKFYLSEERVGQLTFTSKNSSTNVVANGDDRDYKDSKHILVPSIRQVAQYDTPTRKNSNRFRTYDPEGISPSLTTMGGGGLEPCVVEGTRIKYYKSHENPRIVDDLYGSRKPRVYEEYSPTLRANSGQFKVVESLKSQHNGVEFDSKNTCIVRKLTPRECWRLMGCSDRDFDKAQDVNSNTQLYKQAGNAIVVDVLECIFNNLLSNKQNLKTVA